MSITIAAQNAQGITPGSSGSGSGSSGSNSGSSGVQGGPLPPPIIPPTGGGDYKGVHIESDRSIIILPSEDEEVAKSDPYIDEWGNVRGGGSNNNSLYHLTQALPSSGTSNNLYNQPWTIYRGTPQYSGPLYYDPGWAASPEGMKGAKDAEEIDKRFFQPMKREKPNPAINPQVAAIIEKIKNGEFVYLYRYGNGPESLQKLKTEAEKSETFSWTYKGLFGVSLNLSTKYPDSTRKALVADVVRYFVFLPTPTPDNPTHCTLIFQKPLNQEQVNRFNQLFQK